MSDEPSGGRRAAVFGASGTTGVELLAWLERHPAIEVAFATSRAHAGRRLDAVDPAAPPTPLVAPDDVDLASLDVALLCLPHGHAAKQAERCWAAGVPVVDLSGDLRLRAPELHARVYGSPRSAELAANAVYGLTERRRGRVAEARVISNPGCYPTCAALPLAPLVALGAARGPVVVNAVSGVSGAGRSPTEVNHFCSVHADVRPYKLGQSHRHAAEIEQTLAEEARGEGPSVLFNPHLVPLERGLLATITVDVGGLGGRGAYRALLDAYEREAFVRVLPMGEPARIRAAAHTNDAVIGLTEVPGSSFVVLTCAIDNLLKGAAGQAIQNMNLMLGLPEGAGLPSPRAGRSGGAS